MTVYTPDFSLGTETFTYARILGLEWIVPLIVMFIAMVFITRDMDKWKILAFPIMVLELIIGLPVSPYLLLISVIMFVIEALSTQVLGNVIEGYKKDKVRGVAKAFIGKRYAPQTKLSVEDQILKKAKLKKAKFYLAWLDAKEKESQENNKL